MAKNKNRRRVEGTEAETTSPKQTSEVAVEQTKAPQAEIDPRTVKLGHKIDVTVQRTNEENEVVSEEHLEFPSKSMAIVALHRDYEVSRGEIARMLNIRYQFVYNVLKRRGLID